MKAALSLILTMFCLLIFGKGQISAQTEEPQVYRLSLQEAIEFGLESSYETENARRDIAAAIERKWETTAEGLPQIDANVDYQNRLKIPVQLLPAEITGGEPGTFVPVKFGTQQQMTATATARQIIFDGTYIVAVRAAKTFLDFTQTNAEKEALNVRKNIIDAYGNVLLAEESVEILKQNKKTLEENLEDTQALFEEGFREKEDVEQLEITSGRIRNQLRNTQRLIEITHEVLKLSLGIPIENKVILTEDLDQLTQQNLSLGLLEKDKSIEENINYRLAKNQVAQREHELRLEKSRALPQLTTFINYGTNGYSQEFTFLNDNQRWFQTSTWGVTLNVPIFSSFRREAKTSQARIALKQAETEFTQVEQQVRLNIQRAKNEYQTAIDNYQTQKKNLALAKRIENKNQIKFDEGVATSFELKQAQNQLYTSQQDYLQSMVNLLNAKAELENTLNTPNIELEANQN